MVVRRPSGRQVEFPREVAPRTFKGLSSLVASRSRVTWANQLAAHDRGTLGERLELGEGEIARDVFHAAIGGRDRRSGGRCARAVRMRVATICGVSGAGSPMLITPKITVLSPSPSRVVRSRLGWVASIEICSTFEAVSSGRNA